MMQTYALYANVLTYRIFTVIKIFFITGFPLVIREQEQYVFYSYFQVEIIPILSVHCYWL